MNYKDFQFEADELSVSSAEEEVIDTFVRETVSCSREPVDDLKPVENGDTIKIHYKVGIVGTGT